MTVTSDQGTTPTGAPLEEGTAILARVREAVGARVVGQEGAIEDALIAFLAKQAEGGDIAAPGLKR